MSVSYTTRHWILCIENWIDLDLCTKTDVKTKKRKQFVYLKERKNNRERNFIKVLINVRAQFYMSLTRCNSPFSGKDRRYIFHIRELKKKHAAIFCQFHIFSKKKQIISFFKSYPYFHSTKLNFSISLFLHFSIFQRIFYFIFSTNHFIIWFLLFISIIVPILYDFLYFVSFSFHLFLSFSLHLFLSTIKKNFFSTMQKKRLEIIDFS